MLKETIIGSEKGVIMLLNSGQTNRQLNILEVAPLGARAIIIKPTASSAES